MNKNTKKIVIGVVIVILILVIAWLVFQSMETDTVSIGATNEMPNENMGISNAVNENTENEINNIIEENEVDNEVIVEQENKVAENETDEDNNSGDTTDSEIVSGTNLSREEKAIQLAKDYYEEEYGSSEGLYFRFEDINGDGRYIIRAGSAGESNNRFFIVNIDAETVEEK